MKTEFNLIVKAVESIAESFKAIVGRLDGIESEIENLKN